MNLFDKWMGIPRSVNLFFLKAFLLFIAWKTIYLFFLVPDRVIDRPVTLAVAELTSHVLNLISHPGTFTIRSAVTKREFEGKRIKYVSHEDIYINNGLALIIADSCNGLELYVLYAGLIVCFPAPASRKARFIFWGVLLIFAFNIFRCVILTIISLECPAYLDFSHHFLFTFLVGSLIFWLWYVFSKKLTFNARISK
jgi:exosortase/archaeosortase family protein